MLTRKVLDHVSRLLDAYCDVVPKVLELFKREGVDVKEARDKCSEYTRFLWRVLEVYGEGRYSNMRSAVNSALNRYKAL